MVGGERMGQGLGGGRRWGVGGGGVMNIDVPPLGSPTHQFWQRTLIRS
jgi:hypothetical protein